MSRRRGPFEELAPPAGGVERLRARIARAERRRARRRRIVGAAAVATPLLLVAAYVAFSIPEPSAAPLGGFSPTRIGLGLDAAPAEPVTLPPGDRGSVALQRVSLGTDAVVFYLVGSVD